MTTSELSRRERKKEETRRRIFDAAVSLFRERGFEATTVDEITEKADVGRGTFFNYFPRKESVLAYLSDSRLEALEDDAAALLASPASARERVIALHLHAASAYEEDIDLSRYVFGEWMKRGFAPTHEAGMRWHTIIEAQLAAGRASGELRADVPPARGEALIAGAYIATLFEWLYCPIDCRASITGLREELTARLAIVLDGLASRQEAK